MKSTETLVTHCVGRYLIDLPATADYVGSTDEYGSLVIEVEKTGLDGYTKEIEGFEKRLRQTKHRNSPSLLLNLAGKAAGAPVFAYWEHDLSTAVIDVAGYRWIDGFRYRFHLDAEPDMVDQGTAYVSGVVGKLRGQGNEIPDEAGFCIKGGIIVDHNDSDDESTSVTFRLKDMPDVTIEVSTSRNAGKPPETLLSRKPGVFSALGLLGATVAGLHTLHEGDRPIAGMPGEEWLVRAPNDHQFQSHLFTWEAQGRADSTLYPQIRIELRTAAYGHGVAPGASSLTDDQARHLWDLILHTLRLRPTKTDQVQVGVRGAP